MTTILTNATLLPCTDAMPVIAGGWVRVDGAVITALGSGPPPVVPGAEVVDVGGDVVMPGMTGAELAGVFEEKWPRVKILFMSGYMSPAISAEDRHSRQKGFLRKPLCPWELASKVRELLD